MSLSENIESKIVEMKFDNTDFEVKIAETMNSLTKFKAKMLDTFDTGVSTDAATDGMNELGDATNEVSVKFDAMKVIAVNVLNAITDKALGLGKKIVDGFVQPMNLGFGAYEEKAGAVQTIMNATGKSIDSVNEQLDKLIWYTDETSYNFTDMVNSLGKFTSAGIGLEDSVTAMMGISNWAAKSGQGINEASRAYYNLAQSLATGAVKLQDWKSIENANMATVEFKQTAMDTAVELGMLTKTVDGLYTTLSGNAVSTENFSENLTKDAWFTSDVLVKTLGKYGDYSEEVYKKVEETGLTCAEAMELVNDETLKLGESSFKAAQEAKTFTDAINSVKDAMKSGFAASFEYIFGNYLEAKELWTDLANELYDVFVEPINVLNEVLEGWNDLGGRDVLLEGAWNIFNGLISILNVFKETFQNVFPLITSDKLYDLTVQFRDFTESIQPSEEQLMNLRKVLSFIFSTIATGIDLINGLVKSFGGISGIASKVRYAISIIGTNITNLISSLGSYAKKAVGFIESTGILTKALDIFRGAIKSLSGIMDDFSIENLIGGFKKVSDTIGTSVSNMVNSISTNISKIFGALKGQNAISFTDVFNIENWKNGITIFIQNLKEDTAEAVDKIKSWLYDISHSFDATDDKTESFFTSTSNKIKAIGQAISNMVKGVADKFKSLFSFITDNPVFIKIKDSIGNFFKNLFNDITEAFNQKSLKPINKEIQALLSLFMIPEIIALIKALKLVYSAVSTIIGIGQAIVNLLDATGEIANTTVTMMKTINKSLKAIKNAIVFKELSLALLAISAVIMSLTAFIYVIGNSKNSTAIASAITATVFVVSSIVGLLIALAKLSKTVQVGNELQNVFNIAALEHLGKALIGLSIVIGSITFSILSITAIVGLMPEEKLNVVLGVISGVFLSMAILIGEIMGLAALIAKASVADSQSAFKGMAVTLLAMGAFMIALSSSIAKLAKIEDQKAVSNAASAMKEIFVVIGIGGAVVSGILALGKGVAHLTGSQMGDLGNDFLKLAATFLIISGAMLVIAVAIERISEIENAGEKAGTLVGTLTGVLVLAGIFLGVLNKAVKVDTVGVLALAGAIVAIAGSLLVLVVAAERLAALKEPLVAMGELWLMLAGLLITVGSFMAVTADLMAKVSIQFAVFAISMIAIAGSMAILVNVIRDLSSMKWDELSKGLRNVMASIIAVGLALSVFGFMINKIAKAAGVGLVLASVSFAVIAASMMMLVPVINALSQNAAGAKDIGVAILTIATAMSLLGVVASVFGKHMIVGSVGLVAIAAAMLIVAAAGTLFVGIVSSIVSLMAAFADQLVDAIGKVNPVLDDFIKICQKFSLAAVNFSIGMAAFIAVLALAGKAIIPVLEGLGAMVGMAGALYVLSLATTAYANSLNTLSDALSNLLSVFTDKSVLDTAEQAGTKAGQKYVHGVNNSIAHNKYKTKNKSVAVEDVSASAGTRDLKSVLVNEAEEISNDPEIAEAYTNAGATMANSTVTGVIGTIPTSTPSVVDTMKNSISAVAEQSAPTFSLEGTELANVFSGDMGTAIQNVLPDSMSTSITDSMTSLSTNNSILDLFKNIPNTFTSIFNNGLSTGVSESGSVIHSALSEQLNALSSNSEIQSLAILTGKSIGTAVAEGMIVGITGAEDYNAYINEIDAMVKNGQITEKQAAMYRSGASTALTKAETMSAYKTEILDALALSDLKNTNVDVIEAALKSRGDYQKDSYLTKLDSEIAETNKELTQGKALGTLSDTTITALEESIKANQAAKEKYLRDEKFQINIESELNRINSKYLQNRNIDQDYIRQMSDMITNDSGRGRGKRGWEHDIRAKIMYGTDAYDEEVRREAVRKASETSHGVNMQTGGPIDNSKMLESWNNILKTSQEAVTKDEELLALIQKGQVLNAESDTELQKIFKKYYYSTYGGGYTIKSSVSYSDYADEVRTYLTRKIAKDKSSVNNAQLKVDSLTTAVDDNKNATDENTDSTDLNTGAMQSLDTSVGDLDKTLSNLTTGLDSAYAGTSTAPVKEFTKEESNYIYDMVNKIVEDNYKKLSDTEKNQIAANDQFYRNVQNGITTLIRNTDAYKGLSTAEKKDWEQTFEYATLFAADKLNIKGDVAQSRDIYNAHQAGVYIGRYSNPSDARQKAFAMTKSYTKKANNKVLNRPTYRTVTEALDTYGNMITAALGTALLKSDDISDGALGASSAFYDTFSDELTKLFKEGGMQDFYNALTPEDKTLFKSGATARKNFALGDFDYTKGFLESQKLAAREKTKDKELQRARTATVTSVDEAKKSYAYLAKLALNDTLASDKYKGKTKEELAQSGEFYDDVKALLSEYTSGDTGIMAYRKQQMKEWGPNADTFIKKELALAGNQFFKDSGYHIAMMTSKKYSTGELTVTKTQEENVDDIATNTSTMTDSLANIEQAVTSGNGLTAGVDAFANTDAVTKPISTSEATKSAQTAVDIASDAKTSGSTASVSKVKTETVQNDPTISILNKINTNIDNAISAAKSNADRQISRFETAITTLQDNVMSKMDVLNSDNKKYILNLRGHVDNLKTAFDNMGVYIDKKALVGEIATDIDYQLGSFTKMSKRGV